MGIRGAKPSDVRKCLGDLSGYGDIPPGNREGLKEYLRNTSTVDADTGAIIIKSKKNGQVTQLAEDTWRTLLEHHKKLQVHLVKICKSVLVIV